MEDRRVFPANEFQGISTNTMRVFSYGNGEMNPNNPYRHYLRRMYDYRRARRMLEQLIEAGNVVKDGPMVEELCEKITTPLKAHQRRLVYEMQTLENCPYHYTNSQRMGFLCDAVGTGKSLTMLSLIANNKTPSGGSSMKVPYTNPLYSPNGRQPFTPTVLDYISEDARYKSLHSTLIVIPHNLFSQWKTYIQKDSRLTATYISSKKTLNEFVDKLPKYLDGTEQTPDIVLVKSTQYNKMVDAIENKDVEYVNNISYEQYRCDPDSTDFSISVLQDMTTHMRISIRQISNMQSEYRCGQATAKNFAESFNDFFQYMSQNSEHFTRVISTEEEGAAKVVKDVFTLKGGILWDRVVYDEADTIPIAASRSVMARMTWMMSASYRSFIYPYTSPPPHRSGHIRSLIDYQTHSAFYLQHCMFKSSDEAITESFPLPSPSISILRCFTPQHILAAHASNMPQVIDAVNAGDTELAIRLCRCETQTSEEGLIDSLKSTMQQQIDEKERRKERSMNHRRTAEEKIQEVQEMIEALGPIETHVTPEVIEQHSNFTQTMRIYVNSRERYNRQVEQYERELTSLRSRLESMEQRLTSTIAQDCPICMEPIEEGKRAIVKCCNQSFCAECIMQQMAAYQHRTTTAPCPLCRTHLGPDTITILSKKVEDRTTTRLPSKEQALIDLLQKKEHQRILLFSGHDSTFSHLEQRLDQNDITFTLLNGSDGHLQNKIKAWIEGKIRVLCLNSNVLGAGLNLPQATDIIIYHEQSEELQNQIIGRAQRPGRDPDSSLRVWRLAYETEYST